MKVKNSKPTHLVFLKRLAISCLVGGVALFLAIFVMGLILSGGNIPQAYAPPLATMAAGFGAFVSGFVMAKLCGSKGVVTGAAAGAALLLLVGCIALIVSGTVFTNSTLLRGVVMVLASVIGGMFGVNFKLKRKMPKV